MSRLGVWVQGARPRTLGAGMTPVVVGTAAAGVFVSWRFVAAILVALGAGITPVVVGTAAAGVFVPWRFAAALLVALGLQVGVNLANDFHDGVRGVDTPDRLGPPRLTSSGLAPARTVLLAALLSILVAGAAGLALAAATTWWLVPIGALAMLALWLYSGGPRPYAELGLGEVMVFVFFGLMATAGSAYVQAETVPAAAWWVSVPIGLLAVAILVANNLRDIPTDAVAGKRTLAVRLGVARTRVLYRACVVAAFGSVVLGVAVDAFDDGSGLPPWSLLALGAAVVAAGPFEQIGRAAGRGLIAVLVGTARLQVVFGGLLALGLWIEW